MENIGELSMALFAANLLARNSSGGELYRLLFDLAAQGTMAFFADRARRAVIHKTFAGVALGVRGVAIGAARGMEIKLVPQRQELVKMIFQAADVIDDLRRENV